jgi:hypothetical protein
MLIFYINSIANQPLALKIRIAYKIPQMKRRDLTTEEREETRRLANEWEVFRAENKGATQTWLGAETGLGGQSAVSQYLNGVIPLNLTALLAFCRVLNLEPKQISPRLSSMVGDVELMQLAGQGNAPISLTAAQTAREQLLLMAYRVGSDTDRTAMDVLAEQILRRAG